MNQQHFLFTLGADGETVIDGFSLEWLERVTAQLEDWYRCGEDVLERQNHA